MKIIITEEQSKKLFIPRRVDERLNDLVRGMITTNTDIGDYLKRRDIYKDYSKDIDPIVDSLSKDELIVFIKANPFWLNSKDKIVFLLKKLSYDENKDIADNHIGTSFSGKSFYTTPQLKYYELKFEKSEESYKNRDVYVFVGDDKFVKNDNGNYDKVLDIERLMKVSIDSWDDISDYDVKNTVGFMRMRAMQNNKTLYKIVTYHGVLDDYINKTGDEIPDYVLASINEKKERI
jgi:hypothetical protein